MPAKISTLKYENEKNVLGTWENCREFGESVLIYEDGELSVNSDAGRFILLVYMYSQ